MKKQAPHIVVLGPQGSGKGTQSALLSRYFHIPHVSAGDELRREMAEGTPLGKRITSTMNSGSLIPDRNTNAVVKKRLSQPDARHGWIVDGYPRRMGQVLPFMRYAKPFIIIQLELTDEKAIHRLSGRRVCPRGHVYHIRHDPPKKRRGFCDHDGLKLRQRDDDTPHAIRKRLRWTRQETEPMLTWIHGKVPIIHIDAQPSIHIVYQHIKKELARHSWLPSRLKTT